MSSVITAEPRQAALRVDPPYMRIEHTNGRVDKIPLEDVKCVEFSRELQTLVVTTNKDGNTIVEQETP